MSRERLEKLAAERMEALFDKTPGAREFHTGSWIDREYYKRHLIETVLRIRLNNEVDAYGLYKVGSKDNRLAATLAQYLSEENNHEGMFLRDLRRFGVEKDEVDALRPFPSTEYPFHQPARAVPSQRPHGRAAVSSSRRPRCRISRHRSVRSSHHW
jgi:hypothetical protein